MDGAEVSDVMGTEKEGKRGGTVKMGVIGEESEERLPKEILERIQAYLPITDFFRSLLVCKSWHASLLSPAFRKMHAELAPKEDWVLTLARCDHARGIHNSPCVYNPRSRKWVSLPRVCFCPNEVSGNFLASGGMVCFQEGRHPNRNVIICDPCQGSRMAVPVPSFVPGAQLRPQLRPNLSELQLVGFVRDPGCKEFKVFGIITRTFRAAPTVMYDSRKGQWAVTGTVNLNLGHEIERNVVWRGFLYVVGYVREPNMHRWSYKILKCRLEDGIWCDVPSSFALPHEVGLGCLDLVVHEDKMFLLGRVGKIEERDLSVPDCILQELPYFEEWMTGPTLHRAPFYFRADWAGAFAGPDNLLYIQFSNFSSSVLECDLSKTPCSWRLLPFSPAGKLQNHSGLKFVTMPVQPELDAFVASQS